MNAHLFARLNCQFTETLDVVQEALGDVFGLDRLARLDGSTPQLDRELDVRAFNAPGSPQLAYLISTRAGGVGLNLATADVVIIFDSCDNPQVDVQAIARAHRIGQTRQVRVFRMVTEETAEERTIDMANRKFFLSDVVVAGAGEGASSNIGDGALESALSVDEMWSVVLGTAVGLLPDSPPSLALSPQEAESLIDRAYAGEAKVRRPGQKYGRLNRRATFIYQNLHLSIYLSISICA